MTIHQLLAAPRSTAKRHRLPAYNNAVRYDNPKLHALVTAIVKDCLPAEQLAQQMS